MVLIRRITYYRQKIMDLFEVKGDYALPYGQTIEITYTVKSGVLTNGKVIDNTVSAWAAGIPETKASRQVYINSPKK